jgi:hypothetical protein
MAMFKGFKPQAMNKIAGAMGYRGDMNQFQQYVDQDPARQQQMNMYTNAARKMAAGGYVPRFNTGGVANNQEEEEQPVSNRGLVTNTGSTQASTPVYTGASPTQYNITPATYYQEGDELPEGVNVGDQKTAEIKNPVPGVAQFSVEQMYQPGLPIGGTTISRATGTEDAQNVAAGTGTLTGPYLESDPTPGVVRPTAMPQEGNKFAFTPDGTRFEVPISYDFSAGTVQVPTATANTYQAGLITAGTANKAAVTTTESDVDDEMKKVAAAEGSTSGITAVQGVLSTGATPGAPEFDDDFKQGVGFGDLNVTPDQLAEAKGQDEVVPAAKIAQSSGIDPAIAQQATVSVNEIPQAAQIQESNMAQAQLAQSGGFLREDAVAYAAKLNSFSVDNGTLAKAIQGEVGALGTVQGQLEGLMKQFDDGTPVWAAGALRAANAAMASRGLAGSSMAGAAILQAAMESSLPIATQDAQTFNQMNMSNLDRRQQVALTNAAAQQGLSLQNLSNEQQVALQNSTNAFALQTQDLSNMQQTFLANAQIKAAFQGQNLSNQQQVNLVTAARFAEVANMNLNNRQQTALVNNANNLQIDLANLSNRQQSYMSNAQLSAALQGQQINVQQQTAMQNAARFSEAANITFSADQQEQLHNSELMKTIGLANLNTAQATTLQNAATIAAMDSQNLSNRQQAAVQQAQNFLQMDMANLSNEQQTELFKAQQRVQSLFSDQAATNAAAQFNASSENQVDQFFQSLGSQVSQFNATQANAQSQYNAGQANTVNRFNAELNNQRDQFNAQNQLVIAQSNAQWRRQIATADTASVNRANELNANAILDISKQAYSNLWNYFGDTMEWAWTSAESELDRYSAMAIAELDAKTTADASAAAGKSAAGNAIGSLIGTLGAAWITCWVAREVYGKSNPEWFIFRTWLEYDAPKWFKKLYVTHGKSYAKLIGKVPPLKWLTRQCMDTVINNKRKRHNVQTV